MKCGCPHLKIHMDSAKTENKSAKWSLENSFRVWWSILKMFVENSDHFSSLELDTVGANWVCQIRWSPSEPFNALKKCNQLLKIAVSMRKVADRLLVATKCKRDGG